MSDNEDEFCAEITEFTNNLIKDKGYPLEIYQVTTEDGYINSLYRINKNETLVKKNPVLIVHGLTSSVADSVVEDRQLGYFLANNGFDVWMANCRGTTYSRGHIKYNHIKNAEKYWDFSFHELGYYDNPSFIDFVLEKTGFEKLIYVGISQGTTIFSVLMSTRPEYNSKIALACLLCPAISFEYAAVFPLRYVFCYFYPFVMWLMNLLGYDIHQIPLTRQLRKMGRRSEESLICRKIVFNLLNLFAGHRNTAGEKKMDLKKVFVTSPNSASSKQTLHYSQAMRNNTFTQYDYGMNENVIKYGSEKPPSYDFKKVTAPVALFYSKNDMYYGVQDMEKLAMAFGNCVHKHLVKNEKFNHKDFLFHENVIDLVYSHVLKIINVYVCESKN